MLLFYTTLSETVVSFGDLPILRGEIQGVIWACLRMHYELQTVDLCRSGIWIKQTLSHATPHILEWMHAVRLDHMKDVSDCGLMLDGGLNQGGSLALPCEGVLRYHGVASIDAGAGAGARSSDLWFGGFVFGALCSPRVKQVATGSEVPASCKVCSNSKRIGLHGEIRSRSLQGPSGARARCSSVIPG